MDDTPIYSLDDVAELTGLSVSHLTRPGKGPIARLLETYFWQKDQLTSDGKSLTESGLSLLNDYLYNCGKGGTMSYQEWQQSIWEREGKNPKTTEDQEEETAITPLIQVSSYELAPLVEVMPVNNVEASFALNIQQLKEVNFQRGQQLAREVVMPIVEGFNSEQKAILTQMLQALNGG